MTREEERKTELISSLTLVRSFIGARKGGGARGGEGWANHRWRCEQIKEDLALLSSHALSPF